MWCANTDAAWLTFYQSAFKRAVKSTTGAGNSRAASASCVTQSKRLENHASISCLI